jgi:hypothetical protein
MLGPQYPIAPRTRGRCFRGLVKLCGEYGVLPGLYIVPEAKVDKWGDKPVSTGGFSEVWKGTYGGNPVAIKVIRYNQQENVQRIRKARWLASLPGVTSLTVLSVELLPRGHHLEASISPERIGINWGHDER